MVLWLYAAPAPGQTAPPSRIIGELTTVNGGANQLALKTDKGEAIAITLGERTRYARVVPGETDSKNATKIALADLAIGDRVLVLGKLSDDGKTLAATSIYVMTKADIAKKQEHDQAEWQTRSITGVITAITAASKEFTVTMHTAQGDKTVTVESAEKADLRRYTADSVKFLDAKPSSFAELKVGDHVRVLGEKNADATRLKPEVVVSGSFRSVAAQVIAVDASAGEIKVTDLATKKPLIIRVNADTTIRKLPPMMAMALARRYNPQYLRSVRGDAAGGRAAAGGGPRGGGGAGGGAGAGGGGGDAGMRLSGSQGADMQQMLERLPAMPATDLKKDDAIIISSTTGADASRVMAITLIAGVEPLLTRASSGQMSLDWSLDMGMPQ